MELEDKLRVLLGHWIEHNTSHEEEFVKWARRAEEEGLTNVASEISASVEDLQQAGHRLRQAQRHLANH